MKFEEAIITAIELEKKIRGLYTNAMNSTDDPVGKRIFKLLAQEESDHVGYLKKHLAAWKEQGKIAELKIETALPSVEMIQEEVKKIENTLKDRTAPAAELTLLDQAREMELETSGFYEKMVATLKGEERDFFADFVEIEKGHLALVQAELNALSGMGFWFEMPEFDLEGA